MNLIETMLQHLIKTTCYHETHDDLPVAAFTSKSDMEEQMKMELNTPHLKVLTSDKYYMVIPCYDGKPDFEKVVVFESEVDGDYTPFYRLLVKS